jgi:acyl-CoA oxidase
VNAFIVRKNTPGFTPTKIENKIALRCVQNADMLFERCFIPDSARLPGAADTVHPLLCLSFKAGLAHA